MSDSIKTIDAHAHVVQCIAGFTSRGELRAAGGGMAVYADGTTFKLLPDCMGETGASPEDLLKVMDENSVEKAVLLQGQFFGFQNEYTAMAVKKYPDRFVGAGSYDPFCVNVEAVRNRLFKQLGFKIVKFELSNGSGLTAYHPPVDINGEIMRKEYAYACDNGLTVTIDMGRPRNCCWQPEALAKAAKDFPALKFVVCHLLAPQTGDGGLLKQALNKLALPNVWFDLSALAANQKPETYPYPAAVKHLAVAKAAVGAERLMFGSDMPSTLCRDTYAHLKDYIVNSGVFNEAELKKVMYSTADGVYFG
ncbi:MAG: amidohydrolase [Roseburia sp.]|nr:amidohydrolase [Roseburia sp.]